MTQLAVGYRTVVDSGREHRSDGLMKHLGVADVGTLRATNNLTQTLHAGKGVEICYLPGQFGLIQALDRDVGPPSAWLDLVIAAQNITFQPRGQVNLPAGSTTDFWDARADGNSYSQGVSAWSQYDVPGITPISFTLKATARVRLDWYCQYTPPGGSPTYFSVGIDSTFDLDVPDVVPVAGYQGTSQGFGIFANVGAGAHTAKIRFTPTTSGTFQRAPWYTRLIATAFYA